MRLSRRRKSILALITAGAVYLGPASSEAQAYIDPGTTSSFFSWLAPILGLMMACLAVAWTQVRRCGGWFLTKLALRRRNDSTAPTEAETRSG